MSVRKGCMGSDSMLAWLTERGIDRLQECEGEDNTVIDSMNQLSLIKLCPRQQPLCGVADGPARRQYPDVRFRPYQD